jgi:hypothetical protein
MEDIDQRLAALTEYVARLELRLHAETTALRLAVHALTQASAQPEKAMQAYEVLREQHLAALLGSPVRDVHYETLLQATAAVTLQLKDALARPRTQAS